MNSNSTTNNHHVVVSDKTVVSLPLVIAIVALAISGTTGYFTLSNKMGDRWKRSYMKEYSLQLETLNKESYPKYKVPDTDLIVKKIEAQ